MECNCDVCGFDLTDDTGYATKAKEIKLLGATPERKRVIDIFGKNEFSICYVCYLKSLGIKESK